MAPDEEEIHPADAEEGCGFSWDHACFDLGDGYWECGECGATGRDAVEED